MRNHPHSIHRRTTREKAASFPAPGASEPLFGVLNPVIPAALNDGLVPVAALDPHLVVRVPLNDAINSFMRPGDTFQAIVDELLVKGTQVAYPHPAGGSSYMQFEIPKPFLDLLADGSHTLSYRLTIRPTGETVDSRPIVLKLHRAPVGGRCLPRIIFDEPIERSALTLPGLLALPGATLTGVIPDYAGIDPRDSLHLFAKLRQNGIEISAGCVTAATGGRPMKACFDRSTLERIDGSGAVDFYYRVVDAAGVLSKDSPAARLDLALRACHCPETPDLEH